ncbi:MAG: dephospho-CoA kinase [Pseudomonadota bacterium]
MLKIGLTGGIGSGKSTVCRLFGELGVPIIDADIIARQLVESDSPVLKKLVAQFGKQILNPDRSLNRAYLRDLVFSDKIKKAQLDQLMHPLIYDEIEKQLKGLNSPYCIIAIPLLLETQQMQRVDRIVVVDCNADTQLLRVVSRDQVKPEQVLSIIASQMSRQQRLSFADDVIDNTCSPAHLAEQVKRLHNSYNLLATC